MRMRKVRITRFHDGSGFTFVLRFRGQFASAAPTNRAERVKET
jgi:hypothetical protein